MPPLNGNLFRPIEKIPSQERKNGLRGFLEISKNGIVSVGVEFSNTFLPDHVFDRSATRFYFHYSVQQEIFDYATKISFKAMKEMVVKNFAIKVEAGEVRNYIRYEGMLAHTEISQAIKDIESANKKEESF